MPRLGADTEGNSDNAAPVVALPLAQTQGKDDCFLLHGDDLLGYPATHLMDKINCDNDLLGDWSLPGSSDALFPTISSVLDIPLSNSNGTSSTTTTTTTMGGNSRDAGQKQRKKKQMNPQQKEKMLERQRRYRKRKQQSLSEMTKSLEMRKRELNYLRSRNVALGHKSAALEKMIDYATEVISECKEDEEEGEAAPDWVESRVRYLMDIFDHALSNMTVPDEATVNNVIQTVQERSVWRKDVAIAKLQQRLSNMMMRWFSCKRERKRIEGEMIVLMQTRFKIAERMVHIAPNFIIDRLADGWVGQSFNEGLLVNNPVRVDDNAIDVLKESMQVTPCQQAELNQIWTGFCHTWNGILSSIRLQIFEANGLDKSTGDAAEDDEYPGTHYGMLKLLLDSKTVGNMIEMNREQVRSLLYLAKELVETLHPLQFGKVLTFLPGHGPNIMYLSKVLSKGIEPARDMGHVVF